MPDDSTATRAGDRIGLGSPGAVDDPEVGGALGDQAERERTLDTIRATYAAYERTGRRAQWDLSNRGHRRLIEGRDDRLANLLRESWTATSTGALLDVGCGTGAIAALVRDRQLPLAVTGIDLLVERIDEARVRVPGSRFVVGSADDLPFDDGSFDVATAITLFSSLPTEAMEKAVAAEIGRVLRPGGSLIWYDIRFRNPWNPRVHGIGRERLRDLFPGWPETIQAIGVPPPMARRLGRLTPVAYPALHLIAPLRSHLIGCLRKPL
jgi:SAM-dependent methyltransferase